jgi:hypothetical protein
MKNIEISPKEYEKHLNWDDAMMYCQLLTIDGKDDWRLPTKDELKYIYNSKKDFTGYYYWTSTEDNEDSNNNYARHLVSNIKQQQRRVAADNDEH